MKVIIKKTREIKEVSFGYGVNYLIPQGLALKATPENMAKIEAEKLIVTEKQVAKKQSQENLSQKLKGKKIVLKLKKAKGKKTYGSVNKKDILRALGLNKTQAKVILDKPIKEIGQTKVELKIGSEKTFIKVEVDKSEKK
ncbi:50S ribosomal protein L9 [Candidatus Beckwithbacteria bacterium CG10_big_fil_rev_8_21_14_0_10_34_10]|uniref:Large ribosomal subunit protein bL9 n=1 Tax=Candidatus Beckwithbacteria bacterium CG10_big_fil_rev_8_21_14_0_10_34_10 TaxID=1974495 RepID=A0A2H0W936_9BACT|nr:MAG: 50S ribosomal protein L9 [Candidatus Beckwithbacteria bacterium CG10_big_fil_rev_8_21_14_0_10_34_10]